MPATRPPPRLSRARRAVPGAAWRADEPGQVSPPVGNAWTRWVPAPSLSLRALGQLASAGDAKSRGLLGGCPAVCRSASRRPPWHLAPLARPDLPGRLGRRRCRVARCLGGGTPPRARGTRVCATLRLDSTSSTDVSKSYSSVNKVGSARDKRTLFLVGELTQQAQKKGSQGSRPRTQDLTSTKVSNRRRF